MVKEVRRRWNFTLGGGDGGFGWEFIQGILKIVNSLYFFFPKMCFLQKVSLIILFFML